MARPTIRDVAEAAGLSVSTVNRVLAGAEGVREHTVRLVRDAAERIGFYGTGTIQAHAKVKQAQLRFGFLLLQPSRLYYQMIAAALVEAAGQLPYHNIQTQIVFAEDLTPHIMAAKIMELGAQCDVLGVVAAVHPMITEAVDELARRGVPVFGLISQLAATGSVNYVGFDNWKVGRMFAWAVSNLCKTPGKVGVLVGNHRFRCQEMNESGLRSYFREHAPEFTLLEPLSTFETSAIAEEMTEKLLLEHPDVKGLVVAGGGMSGVINALRAVGRGRDIITVGHQLMENTRLGLLDGTLSMVISNPLERFATETIRGMARAVLARPDIGGQTIVLPFEIYTRENI
jgi:LacI family transcriptional regulator